MNSWILGGKKSEKKLLENLILDCTFWATVEKKSLKTLVIDRGSAIKFRSWIIDVGESLLLLFLIEIIDLIPFQFLLISWLLILKKSMKYCYLESLRRVGNNSNKIYILNEDPFYGCFRYIWYIWKKEYSFSLWIFVNLELSKTFVEILILVYWAALMVYVFLTINQYWIISCQEINLHFLC